MIRKISPNSDFAYTKETSALCI